MKSWRLIGAGVCVCMGVFAAGCAPGRAHDARTAAACTLKSGSLSVDVSIAKLQGAVDRQAAKSQTAKAGGQVANEQTLNERAIRQVVADELWVSMASREGVEVTDTQLDAEMLRIRKDQFIDDAGLMRQILELEGYTPRSYRQHAKAQLAYRRMKPSDSRVHKQVQALSGSCLIDDHSYKIAAADRQAIYQARPTL